MARLQVHLTQMQREGLVCNWSDRQILVGAEFSSIIRAQFDAANLFLMMLSPDFIASPYCYGVEVKRALERQACGDAMVIPIIVKPCDWKSTPFANLKVAPDDAKPICDWRPQDRGWNNVVDRIRFAIVSRGGVAGL